MGDINSHFSAYEKSVKSGESDNSIPLANSMLVLMVKGLFSSFEFPYAQFPCSSITGSQLYTVFWEAVSRLELNGFRVLGLTCDGLAANRRLFRMHTGDSTTIHKAKNPYALNGRFLFFFSDPPHLIKTVRNAWAIRVDLAAQVIPN